MMDGLWNWFEILARINQEERERWSQMQGVFSERKYNSESFQIPACWRRRSGIGGGRRGVSRDT